jgi:hypothetical protein
MSRTNPIAALKAHFNKPVGPYDDNLGDWILVAKALVDAAVKYAEKPWLEVLEIGEDQQDDAHGPFTPEECALGSALFRHTQRDRDAVTGVAGPKFDDDWSKVSVGIQFGWYAAARELLRDAQGALLEKGEQ